MSSNSKYVAGQLRLLLGFGRADASPHEELYLSVARQRLEGFGFHVSSSDPTGWNDTFDYSSYDVVALVASCNPVRDPKHLLQQITKGNVGFVVFGAWNCHSTLQYFGLIEGEKVKHQAALAVRCQRQVGGRHFVVDHLDESRTYAFGIKYVSCILRPGEHTSVLLHVDSDASLVVHQKLRIAVSHWCADPTQHDGESPESVECTRRTVLWAAGIDHAAPSPGPETPVLPLVDLGPLPMGSRPVAGPAELSVLPDASTATAQLIADYLKLLDNEALADVVFRVDGRELYANKAILAVRSRHFHQWLIETAAGGEKKAAEPAQIVVQGVEYLAFRVVLEFLYTNGIRADLSPTTLLNVLVLAQEYDLPLLRTMCENTILGSVDSTNVIPMLIAAHINRQTEIKDMGMDFMKRHMDAVKKAGNLDMLEAHPVLMLELLKM